MASAARAVLTMLLIVSSAQAGRVKSSAQAQASAEATEEATRINNKLSSRPWKPAAALLLMANPAAAFTRGMPQPLGRAAAPVNLGIPDVSRAVPEVSARARGVSMMSGDDGSAEEMSKAAENMAQDALDKEGSGVQPLVERLANDEDEFKKFCYGLPGSTAPMGEFDPAGFTNGASKADVYRLREAELTHGRVGMLAAAGFLVQENFHPLFSGVKGPAINQIPQLPPALWFGMTLGIGICEATRIQRGWANPFEDKENIQKLKEGYYPGDLGFDPLGLKPDDPKELRDLQNKELNNGRLGMLAAAGFMAQEAVTGTTWGPSLGCDVLPGSPWCQP